MTEKMKDLILLVDDNRQNLELLGSIIKGELYSLAFAASGKEALHYLESENPDLILLDVMMPEMNGYDVCRKIKKNPQWKDIPVIFLTAKNEAEDIVEGFKAGGTDYVTKPFSQIELIARIENQLAIKRAREEIKTLKGFIPICSNCKSIRDDEGYWKRLEDYIQSRTDAEFSHSLCEKCAEELYGQEPWFIERMKDKGSDTKH